MRFNFARSRVMWSARRSGRTVEVDSTKLPPQTIKIAVVNVRCIVSKHLDDMSTRVVDFGTHYRKGKPTHAVIAVGSREKLTALKRSLRVV